MDWPGNEFGKPEIKASERDDRSQTHAYLLGRNIVNSVMTSTKGGYHRPGSGDTQMAAENHNPTLTSSPGSPTCWPQHDTSQIPSLSCEDCSPTPLQPKIKIYQSHAGNISTLYTSTIPQHSMQMFSLRRTGLNAQGVKILVNLDILQIKDHLVIQSSISANTILQILLLWICNLKAIDSAYGLFLVAVNDCIDKLQDSLQWKHCAAYQCNSNGSTNFERRSVPMLMAPIN